MSRSTLTLSYLFVKNSPTQPHQQTVWLCILLTRPVCGPWLRPRIGRWPRSAPPFYRAPEQLNQRYPSPQTDQAQLSPQDIPKESSASPTPWETDSSGYIWICGRRGLTKPTSPPGFRQLLCLRTPAGRILWYRHICRNSSPVCPVADHRHISQARVLTQRRSGSRPASRTCRRAHSRNSVGPSHCWAFCWEYAIRSSPHISSPSHQEQERVGLV